MYSDAVLYAKEGFSEEIRGFKIIDILPNLTSRVIAAPVESGEQSFDNKVIDPYTIKVLGAIVNEGAVAADVEQAEDKIIQMFYNRKYKFYSLSSRSICFDNLILQNAPWSQKSEKPDNDVFELVFVQAMIVQGKGDPSDGENSNTAASGFRAAQPI